MNRRLRIRAWATGTLLLAAAVGCASQTVTDPASNSTKPSASSMANPGLAAAQTTVRRYYSTLDQLRADKNVPLNGLTSVTTGVQLAATRHLLTMERARGEHQSGSTIVETMSAHALSSGSGALVQVDVCWNVANVVILNRSGRSVVSANRQEGWTRFLVASGGATSPARDWQIESGQNLERSPCAHS